MTKVKKRPIHLTIVVSPSREAIVNGNGAGEFLVFRCTDPSGGVHNVGFRIENLSCCDRIGKSLPLQSAIVPGLDLNFTAIDRVNPNLGEHVVDDTTASETDPLRETQGSRPVARDCGDLPGTSRRRAGQ